MIAQRVRLCGLTVLGTPINFLPQKYPRRARASSKVPLTRGAKKAKDNAMGKHKVRRRAVQTCR